MSNYHPSECLEPAAEGETGEAIQAADLLTAGNPAGSDSSASKNQILEHWGTTGIRSPGQRASDHQTGLVV